MKFSVFLNRRIFVMHFVSVSGPIHENYCDGMYCKADVLISLKSNCREVGMKIKNKMRKKAYVDEMK